MKIDSLVADLALNRPRRVIAFFVAVAVILVALAGLPSIWPRTFSPLQPLKVDTDPENMLPHDAPVRVFHDEMKEKMSLHDMVVVGVVNDQHSEGVFNPDSLKKIHELTNFAQGLRWKDDRTGETEGVVVQDMIAPSVVDNIEQGAPGEIKFEWLMRSPPETQDGALSVRDKALNIPFLKGTLVSEDGKAIAIYLPITNKDVSSKIYGALNRKIEELGGPEEFHITGLPVAEDVFGVEMFKQMAMSAPVAMVIIFLLLWFFFKRAFMAAPPMIDSMIAAMSTMGLLVVTGNTVHIMSSMIPIFIIPIAVLDDVHILSEFFDRYSVIKDRKKTLKIVLRELFVPMFYTTLTTAVGFASLALAPIPPVQVFGLFVAFGVIVAWLCSILVVPSLIMLVPERVLEGYGVHRSEGKEILTPLGRALNWIGRFTYRRAMLILSVFIVLVGISVYGISLIQINDNPTKWFTYDHPIRVADRVLNSHFGGTYMAYLALTPPGEEIDTSSRKAADGKTERETGMEKEEAADSGSPALPAGMGSDPAEGEPDLPSGSGGASPEAGPALPGGLGGEEAESRDQKSEVREQKQEPAIFKDPEVLRYIDQLENFVRENLSQDVGKTNSLSTIVKTVYRDLMAGVEREGRKLTAEDTFRIPDTRGGVAQCLIQFQNSHRPQDLWHFTTPNHRTGNIWFQLTSGDNQDMTHVARTVNQYIEDNPPPVELKAEWFGLTYINVVWQQEMVAGMLKAFLGSFLAVFLMMSLLYRSVLWGALCMIPLTVTIAFIYGVIGLIGKDYDMPVAVLSALSLGLAVDYAIHFLTRSRNMYLEYGSWLRTSGPVFGEPALAISRNAIVVGVGFLPLLLAPLTPYKTVGTFIAAILAAAGLISLLILPSIIKYLERILFPRTVRCSRVCHATTCFVTTVALAALIDVNLQAIAGVGWTKLILISVPSVAVVSIICYLLSGKWRAVSEAFVKEEKGGSDE
ncbi:MAG: efflux RND transporter permease subunit [Desulfurivibrionaceae bacterium]